MADNELLIKINADAKNAEKAFDDIKSKTEDLEGQLATVAKISAVAFAALNAEIFFSVKAFGEAEQASRQLTNALQNQGIYTAALAESYKAFAVEVQNKTGIDDDAIIQSQAIVQSYIGQTRVTKELTSAIVDLSVGMKIDLASAAELVGKTIGTDTNAFGRYGLELSNTASRSERFSKVLEFINIRFKDSATVANQGVGSINALKTAFGNLQEAIGAKLAPTFVSIVKSLTNFINFLEQSPKLVAFGSAAIVFATALAGIGVAIPLLVSGFTTLSAAMTAFGVTANISLGGLPLLIAAISGAVTLLVFNWDKAWNFISASLARASAFISQNFEGLKLVIAGAFDPLTREGPAKVEAGLKKIRSAYADSYKEFARVIKEGEDRIAAEKAKADEKQDPAKAAFADKQAAKERQKQALILELKKQETELLALEATHQSQILIELKQKEIAILKALQEEHSAAQVAILRNQYEQVKALETEQNAEEVARQRAFNDEVIAARAELADVEGIQNATIRDAQREELRASMLTDAEIENKILADRVKARIETNNRLLEEQKKYGIAYAQLNKFLRSEEVQGFKTATAELVALQQSKNETLKTIGKAAAIAQISIKTSEAAMNIYAGFSTIPIIGPALGIAGAAAAIAFGAEQIGNVLAVAEGGLIEGGVPGRDSVPALLMPGELVVPKKNFNDVVGSVRGATPNSGNAEMIETLKRIEEKTGQNQSVIVYGDFLADETYIDSLVRKVSDAVQYRNGQIYGVT